MASRKKKQMGVVKLARGHGFVARVGFEKITANAWLELVSDSYTISSVTGDDAEPGEFQRGVWVGLLVPPSPDGTRITCQITLCGLCSAA